MSLTIHLGEQRYNYYFIFLSIFGRMSQVDTTSTIFGRKLSNGVLLGIILLITLTCLFPTLQNDWVNWDDDSYVLRNQIVQSLAVENISAMFTSPHQVGLYHPLTLFSLAVDYHFWETDAFGFHLTNLLLHLLNTCLVFVFFKKINSSQTVAFFAALLFGIHPMHVESVAWISARKDVLYTFFFMLSIISYLYYSRKSEKRKIFWYTCAVIGFACSLLSKSLAFTLPLVLVLLDYLNKRSFSPSYILDKLPFFLLTSVALVMTKYGQQASDSMLELAEYPLHKTVFLGSYNAVAYSFKALMPVNLSIFHPFPFIGGVKISLLMYASVLPLIVGFYFLYRSFKKSRAVFFGIAFFLITIGPVLQVIPFGKAISSERYTYVPYIGLFYLIAMGIQSLLKKSEESKQVMRFLIPSIVGLWVLFLGVQSHRQSKVWRNSETLWTQSIERYPNNYWAYLSRGTYRVDQHDLDGALKDLNKSIALYPTAQAFYERGRMYEQLADLTQASEDYSRSILMDPNYAKPYLNQGILFARGGDMEKAATNFAKAIELDDNYALAHFNLGMVYKQKGENKNALNAFTKAIQLEPNNPLFLRNRGVLNNTLTNYNAAITDFERAMPLEPNSGEPYLLRSMSYFHQGKIEAALNDAKTASTMGVMLPEDYLEELRSAD